MRRIEEGILFITVVGDDDVVVDFGARLSAIRKQK
jgi:hypothetical protein